MRLGIYAASDDGCLSGVLTANLYDPVNVFCEKYMTTWKSVIKNCEPPTPVVVTGPWLTEEDHPMRRLFCSEEQPYLSQSILGATGVNPDYLIVIPFEGVQELNQHPSKLLVAVLIDAAGLESSSCDLTYGNEQSMIAWAGIAARLVRASESSGLLSKADVKIAKKAIPAHAFGRIAEAHYGWLGPVEGAKALVQNNPGLTTRLAHAVETAWLEDPVSLPCDLSDIGGQAYAASASHPLSPGGL